ncbi:MAG: sigma-B regulation protein RsbU (phosphoserine phosphatase) [Crocinitomicaceae bacterium]|jgi:sigma-B regulation protein RsbU (phosphoserine phosphatase)
MDSILIIEDNLHLRKVISEILEMKGYHVENAINGAAGLSQAKKNKPDLVICDINMPVMGGIETIKKFQKFDQFKFIPFVFLSAKTAPEDIRLGMNLGASDYLTKPFDHEELLQVVFRLIKKSKELSSSNNDSIKDIQYYLSALKSAENVQHIILPSTENIQHVFPNNFNIYLPKDTISGDFYWLHSFNNYKLIAVADCTGHGASGALLTMIYYQFLNTAVEQYKLYHPRDILLKVNELMIEFMKSSINKISHNTVDIGLCMVNYDTQEVIFAGALRPLLFTTTKERNDLTEHQILTEKDHSLYCIKGDRRSIGTIDQNFEIKENIIPFSLGDRIYLTSDGFADQFGGDQQKKYLSSKFKQLILSVQNKSIQDQKKLILEEFNNWKGNLPNVDDVTLVGIQL